MDSEARPTDQSESSRSASQNLGSDRAREPTRHRKRSPPSGGWASYRSSLSDFRARRRPLGAEGDLAGRLCRSQLGDQRMPACEEEPSLLRQRDMGPPRRRTRKYCLSRSRAPARAAAWRRLPSSRRTDCASDGRSVPRSRPALPPRRLPLTEQPLHLPQLPHDLLGRVPASFHRDVLLRPPSWAKGLSSTAVPFQGVGSPQQHPRHRLAECP